MMIKRENQEQLVQVLNNAHPLVFLKNLSKGILCDSDKKLLKRIKANYHVPNSVINTVVLYALAKDNYLNENYITSILVRALRTTKVDNYNALEFFNNLILTSNKDDTLNQLYHYFFTHYKEVE